MPKPICVACRRFFRPKKNGFRLIEGKPKGGSRAPPGLTAPELWAPYKVWIGDLWSCQGCGTEIVVGFGESPVSQDYKPGFHEACECLIQINDC